MIAVKIFLCIMIAIAVGILGGMVVVVIQADLEREDKDDKQGRNQKHYR